MVVPVSKMQLEPPVSWYLRASSYQQEEDSHERQQEIIKRFLLDNSLTVAPENQFSDFRARDESAFGKDFQALLAKIRKGQVKTIIVANLDRWGTEDVDQFFEFRSILLKHGCKLWSVEDGDLTSREMVQIITIIVKAEQSREYVKRMAKNIASGKARRAGLGYVQGGKASVYGYDKVCFNSAGRALWLLHYETPNKKLQFSVEPDGTPDFNRPPVIWEGRRQRPPKSKTDYILLVPSREMYGDYRCIDGDRVETVKTVYRYVIDKSWPLRKTARIITDMGHTIYGHGFRPQHIQKMIPNEKYRGDMTWNKTCRAKYAEYVKGEVREVTPVKTRSGKLKRLDRPPEEWDVITGTHTGLVDAPTWEEANKWLKEKCKKRRANSTEFYLRPLLWCAQCGKPMFGRMQHRTGANKTKVRYPGYFCGSYKDKNKFEQVHSHWIPHAVVEKWLFEQLALVGKEVDLAQDVKSVLALAEKYGEGDQKVKEFFGTGIREYLKEIRVFCRQHQVKDRDLLDLIGTVARHPDWNFAERGFNEVYDQVKARLREIDAKKVQTAKTLLEEKKIEHRQSVQAFVKVKDELSQQVIQEEIARLVDEIKALEEEAVPFLERYKEKVQELEEFQRRFRHLLKTVRESDLDHKAQRLAEAIERIELHFLPFKKWQRNRLDTEKSRIVFRDSFATNVPFA
jgi:hypothetical protein